MGKPREGRINVPKLIAAHAHEDVPNFTPKEKRAIAAYMGRYQRKEGNRGKA